MEEYNQPTRGFWNYVEYLCPATSYKSDRSRWATVVKLLIDEHEKSAIACSSLSNRHQEEQIRRLQAEQTAARWVHYSVQEYTARLQAYKPAVEAGLTCTECSCDKKTKLIELDDQGDDLPF